MKKLVSLISALTMCAVMVAPMASSAVDEQETKKPEKTATITVDYTPEEAYIISIPDSVTVGENITVTASGACLPDYTVLMVSVEGSGELTYKDKDGMIKDTLEYTIDLAEEEDNIVVSAGETEGEKIFEVELDEKATPKYAETYTDTVTFTVEMTKVEEETPEEDTEPTSEEGTEPTSESEEVE